MKDLEGLRLQALLSIAKGDYDGHPFRGNQWTRRASRGRAAPKDPTAGSQGGGSGKAKSTLDILRRELESRGPKPAGKDEYTMSEYGSGRINLRIKESALPKEVLAIHRKAQNGAGVDLNTMHSDKASALKATKDPAQTLVTHYTQMKERAKDGLLDATTSGKAGKQMRDARLAAFKTAETALSELATLGYKQTSTSTPKPAKKTKQQIADEKQALLSSDPARTPAKAPTAPKPTKKKTTKEKDSEWEALTAKQKKIYEKAPADMSHDDAIALALGL